MSLSICNHWYYRDEGMYECALCTMRIDAMSFLDYLMREKRKAEYLREKYAEDV